jgi:RNA polymerase sigma-70 factor (sigma-E family)
MALSLRDEEFSAFVRDRRHELLRSACLLTAGDTHRAEDLVQTALAKLYLAWPRIKRDGSHIAYTWRIMVNAHVDETRRPWWRRERSVAEPPDIPHSDDFPDVTGGGAVRMRATVVLRYWADFSIAETAQILGCSEGTVKSQAAKGIARLRETLGSAHEMRSV